MKKVMMLVAITAMLAVTFQNEVVAQQLTDPAGSVFNVIGKAGITKRIASSDTSQTLSSTLTVVSGHFPIGALITCESFDVRIAFGTTAVQTGSAEVGHVLAAGSSMWLGGDNAVNAVRFINKTNGSNGILQVTYYYQ